MRSPGCRTPPDVLSNVAMPPIATVKNSSTAAEPKVPSRVTAERHGQKHPCPRAGPLVRTVWTLRVGRRPHRRRSAHSGKVIVDLVLLREAGDAGNSGHCRLSRNELPKSRRLLLAREANHAGLHGRPFVEHCRTRQCAAWALRDAQATGSGRLGGALGWLSICFMSSASGMPVIVCAVIDRHEDHS